MTGGFGSRLREARERRGISLRQIANATKISVSALEALERNDISRLPGGIFSRAFVRSYAMEVGLDPEETIQEFIAQFPHDSVTAGHPAAEQSDDNELHESHRRMASVFVRLIAVSVPIVAAVLYFGARGTRRAAEPDAATTTAEASTPAPEVSLPPAPESAASSPAPPAASPPAEPAGATSPADVKPPPAAAPSASGVPPAQAAQRITVGLLATAPCWVSATVDGERVVARELQPGERQTFDVGRDIVLTAGDAAALDVTLNGAGARRLGASGQVVTVRMTPSNFRNYLASP
jgi:cytoskeletal protein RodZ